VKEIKAADPPGPAPDVSGGVSLGRSREIVSRVRPCFRVTRVTGCGCDLKLCWIRPFSEGWLIMPTDLVAAFARKHEVQAQAQTQITMMLVWLIIYLVMLVLLFAEGLCLAQ